MKKITALTLLLLVVFLASLALATDSPTASAAASKTNGAVLSMTLAEYKKDYNTALVGTVPPTQNLLNVADEIYIAAARTLLLEALASPDTATIHEAALYEADPYGRFCVWFDVTEAAAFGTFTRGSYYVFIKGLDSDGMVYYLDGKAVLAGDDPQQIKDYRAASEFGVNPAEQAVQAYLHSANAYTQKETIRLSVDEVYLPMHFTGRGYAMVAYVEAATDQIAGIQLSIGEEQLRSFPMAERNAFLERCLASVFAAAQGETDTGNALSVINKLFDTSRLVPSEEFVYENGLLYGCFAENGSYDFVVMPVSEDVCAAKTYWWVNHSVAYLTAQGDSALQAKDYDSAIWYYEEVGLTADTSSNLARAYYEKAENLLASERFDQAIAFFEKAENFSDSPARLAETYYKKGDTLYLAGDTEGAKDCFALAGNYEDANQRFLSCCYWLGEDALVAKEYDAAEAYFEQAVGYLDSDIKIKQVNYERAEQLAQAGDEAAAVIYYERAQGYMDADDKAGAELYTKGEAALANGDYEAAVQFFTQAGNYKDSVEKLQQIADLEHQQAYEGAIELYEDYFSNLLGNYAEYNDIYYRNAHSALTVLEGYRDSADLIAKLDEANRIMTFLQVCAQELSVASFVYQLSETSPSNAEVILETTDNGDKKLVFKAAVDRSAYSASYTSPRLPSRSYNDFATLLSIMMTGYVESGNLTGTFIPDEWKEVNPNERSMTCFADGYKLEIVIKDYTVTISATKNEY